MTNSPPAVTSQPAPPETVEVNPKDILVLQELQARMHLDEETVEDYIEVLRAGKEMPQIRVIKLTDTDNAGKYAVVDGFHRLEAINSIPKVKTIHVLSRDGTLADAIDAATSANQDHGLRRTNADKRRAVLMAINLDKQLKRKRSDRQIAAHVGVHNSTVSEIRGELSGKKKPEPQAEEPSDVSSVAGGTAPRAAIDHDELRIPINDLDLAVIFQEGPRFDEIDNWLQQIVADATAISQTDAGAELDIQTFTFDVKGIQDKIKFARPYTICPFGPKCDVSCRCCKGRNWTTKAVFERLDDAVKSKHLQLAAPVQASEEAPASEPEGEPAPAGEEPPAPVEAAPTEAAPAKSRKPKTAKPAQVDDAPPPAVEETVESAT